MNIWMFNHYAITPEYPGGTRHFEICKNLARHGHQVMLFASNYIHMNFRFLPIPEGTNYKIDDFGNFKFTWLKTYSYKKNDWRRLLNMLSYCRQSMKVTKQLVREGKTTAPDVVFGSTVHPFTPLMASRLARKYKVPFIFEIRDLWPQTFFDMGIWKKKSLVARFFKWIEVRTVRKADTFVVLSPATVDYLKREYQIDESRIVYMPNGVDLDLYTPGSVSTPDAHSDGPLVLIYLGGIEQVHNLDTLFEAMEKLEKEQIPVELHIYGDGKRREYFQERFPLSNIKWMGSVKKSEVPAALASGHILYLSTGKVFYGSENKLFEYLASGKPVISSVYMAHNDVVKEIEAGISVPPEDVNELVEAVKQMVHIPQAERIKMGRNGRKYAEENHHWPLLVKRLLNALSPS